jgi:hypothetical protein
MNIRLVTNIKNQAVYIRIIYGFECNGKFYNAQIGCQMAAGAGHAADQKFPDFLAKLQTVLVGQLLQIIMVMNRL